MDTDGSSGGDERPWICKVELPTQIPSAAPQKQHQILLSGSEAFWVIFICDFQQN